MVCSCRIKVSAKQRFVCVIHSKLHHPQWGTAREMQRCNNYSQQQFNHLKREIISQFDTFVVEQKEEEENSIISFPFLSLSVTHYLITGYQNNDTRHCLMHHLVVLCYTYFDLNFVVTFTQYVSEYIIKLSEMMSMLFSQNLQLRMD